MSTSALSYNVNSANWHSSVRLTNRPLIYRLQINIDEKTITRSIEFYRLVASKLRSSDRKSCYLHDPLTSLPNGLLHNDSQVDRLIRCVTQRSSWRNGLQPWQSEWPYNNVLMADEKTGTDSSNDVLTTSRVWRRRACDSSINFSSVIPTSSDSSRTTAITASRRRGSRDDSRPSAGASSRRVKRGIRVARCED